MTPLSDSHSRAADSDQRVEDRLQVERRAADHLEHIGGRGLLLQGLAEIARCVLHLVEQPDILDRDHRLVGEGGDELDLLLGERLDPLARQHDHADRLRSRAATARRACVRWPASAVRFMQRVFGISHDIGNLNRAPFEHGAAGNRAAVDGQRVVGEEVDIGLGVADSGAGRYSSPARRMMKAMSASQSCAAEFTSVSSTGCRSKVERLMILSTSPTAVCCCSDSLRSSVRACTSSNSRDVLDGDHGLVGEHLQQADVLFAERARCDAGDGDDADGLAVVHQRREQHAAIAARPRNVSCRRLGLGVRQFRRRAIARAAGRAETRSSGTGERGLQDGVAAASVGVNAAR